MTFITLLLIVSVALPYCGQQWRREVGLSLANLYRLRNEKQEKQNNFSTFMLLPLAAALIWVIWYQDYWPLLPALLAAALIGWSQWRTARLLAQIDASIEGYEHQ